MGDRLGSPSGAVGFFVLRLQVSSSTFLPGCFGVVFGLAVVFANGHTSSNTPDPIRTRKLSGERPGQYWGGGPPGKPLGCCWLFIFVFLNGYLIGNLK